jgi:hypothetical protein
MQYSKKFKFSPLKMDFFTAFTWGNVNRDYTILLGNIPKTNFEKCDINMCNV